MKNLLTLAFNFIPFFIFSQNIDTAAVIRQVDSLLQVCRTLTGHDKYDDALQVIETAKKQAKEVLGLESACYSSCIFYQGRVFLEWGKYAEAETWYLEAKAIQERVLGKEHLDYAQTLNDLASVYRYKGEYDKAEPLFLEAKAIREKLLGKQHPIYATSLYNLANFYRNQGEYKKALLLHLEAKAIREKVLGKENLDYIHSLNNLALVYWDMSEYDKAIKLFLDAKVIFEKALGKENPFYPQTLNGLAILYRVTGNYEKAEPLYLEAKAIREKTLGKENPDYALNLSSLANLYREMGNYAKSEPLYLEAKAIRERTLGKENSDYAQTLNNLAVLYHYMGKYDKAELLFLEAKVILEKALGKLHPDYAECLNNLAELYRVIGHYEKAEPLHLEAQTIREKALGKGHPDYAQSLYNLALVYRDNGDRIKATSYFLSSNMAAKSLLQKAASYSSENEMLQYQILFEERFDALLHFTKTHPTDSLIFAAYDNALSLNIALLFNAVAREKSIAQADSSTRDIHSDWKSCHFQLAKQYVLPIAQRNSARVARLEEQANEYEKELVRRSPAFVESRREVYWHELRDRLRPGEAAIEFFHYRIHDRKSADSDKSEYAALILLPGVTEAPVPRWVTLFEERQLTALLEHLNASKEDIFNQLYTSPALYELVWKPLEKWLGGVERIYYAPSGLLHRLSPGAFQCGENQVLAEKYDLHRFGSTRQLVTDSHASAFAGGDAVVYGGIRYEMDSIAISVANQNLTHEETDGPDSFNSLRGGDSSAWDYLKWTEVEAKSIAKLLTTVGARVEVRQGYMATEESFASLGKKSSAPKVLHLATHAFFFPDPKFKPRDARVKSEIDATAFIMSEHPMIRSGLVLAGANHTWAGGKPLKGMEDGILTAYEISQMNLGGTELVVLSACETGLGDIKGNEGVYGLQRAFKIAGAKYLVMSLWQVPDYQTEKLMAAFYTEWLKGKKTIPDAFRSAQLQMRAQHPKPFNWAGFVLVE
ncbi:MAG: CHAT domain-containing protein [Saprospiraceae bacterium]